jgi:serine/threonine protein kinase
MAAVIGFREFVSRLDQGATGCLLIILIKSRWLKMKGHATLVHRPMEIPGATAAQSEVKDSPLAGESSLEEPPVAALPAAAPCVPDYELIQRIGHGAYGDVWLARSKATGVLRAAKIVWRRSFEDNRPFQREFEGIQRFEGISRQHPSQLALFHIGRNEQAGYFYYVMELADALHDPNFEIRNSKSEAPAPDTEIRASAFGLPSEFRLRDSDLWVPHTLRTDLEQGRLPAERVLEIGLALSEALGHLHSNGLVHRDVKPSNVIFVNGRPKLADIGLVTDASDQCSIVGTEGYLPPEGPGTPQADIFALGKVLYEVATGMDRREFPRLPNDLREWPDAKQVFELNEVVVKACDLQSGRRYQSAEEIREDLELLQRGRSIKSRRTWSKRLAACRKTALWGGLVALAATAALFFADRLPEREMRSAIAEVNNLVAQGDFCLKSSSEERLVQAKALFQRAIELDPTFVPAHFGLFSSYVRRGAFQGSSDLQIPLQSVASNLTRIAPNLSESRQAAVMVHWSNWRFREAVADARLASQMPAASKEGRACAHGTYGWLLVETGKPEAALAEYRLAVKADPADATQQHHLANAYFALRKFDLALEQYQRSIDLEPRHYIAYRKKGEVYEDMGRFIEAIQEFETGDRMVDGENAEAKNYYDQLREAVRQGGGKRYWERRLELALSHSPPEYYDIATYYARLGKKDKAYEWLRRACEKKSFYGGLMHDLCWDHNDPEFQAIARGIGLLQ